MKKKLIKIANQILTLEQKLQNGENMQENLEKMENLTKSLSEQELWEVNEYLESKLNV
jgi:prophage maintenance system killer protein